MEVASASQTHRGRRHADNLWALYDRQPRKPEPDVGVQRKAMGEIYRALVEGDVAQH